MGFLDSGYTLDWDEAKKHAKYIREHGIVQFLKQYQKVKDRKEDYLKWGDEIEYMIVTMNSQERTVCICLTAAEHLPKLQKDEIEDPETCSSCWRPEYGSFMLESTPGQPYGSSYSDILLVEPSMKYRREVVQSLLSQNEYAMQLTSFPLMGVGVFTAPAYPPRGYYANSYYIPDQVINPHPRFGTLTRNIRLRRGSNVAIRIPVFKDKETKPIPVTPAPPIIMKTEETSDEGVKEVKDPKKEMPDIALEDFGNGYEVHMDAMAFGMGCNCLQCTFQCCNVDEARSLYDQLAIVSPLVMALTAASPIHRGYLVDTDVRWNVIAGSVDDRNREERELDPLKDFPRTINKSRYGSIDCFISLDDKLKDEYNDLDLVYDEEICETLLSNGIDQRLSRHLAHLFIRDPLVIYSHKIEIDDDHLTDHFENIQSTNWQTVRFKLPPPNSSIGWRVEFRTMELSLTDFENAAFVVFIQLLIRTINTMELNFYLPISKVDENMEMAHRRDACLNEKFWFRDRVHADSEAEASLMTLDEIFNGKKDGSFPGLINLIQVFLDTTNIEDEVREVVEHYLVFIGKRASGELQTTANWMRSFVQKHPFYKNDSIVSPGIAYDLMAACHKISNGKLAVPFLVPPSLPPGCPTGSSLSSCKGSSSSKGCSSSSSSSSSTSSPSSNLSGGPPSSSFMSRAIPSKEIPSISMADPLSNLSISPFVTSLTDGPTLAKPDEFSFARAEQETSGSYYCEKCGKRHSKHTSAVPK
mmetsp:Transcript_21607/g.29681  ORF Transcript_21607/g.29681 Transcript_21607/m.29681 type:complete len:754 (+) Transcript_21607:73-2334(+)